MKTLYLHIGTPKTATTSLQYFLFENQEVLQKKGFCYPTLPYKYKRVNKARNGHFLVARKMVKGKRDILEEERIFREGMDIIENLFEKYDNVILSDENIWREMHRTRKDIWDNLKQEADMNDFNIKVIVYFRRQDVFASSWYNQHVKSGLRRYSMMKWEEFIRSDPPILDLDYNAGLEKIESVIEKENIIVRRFDKKYFKNHSVYEDFLDAVGINWSSEFKILEKERNVKLSGNTLEMKRILNSLPNLTDEDNLFFRNILLNISKSELVKKGESMFSEKEAREFMKKYEEGNRNIMKKYFSEEENEELFNMNFKKLKKWEPDHTKIEEDILLLLGNVIIMLRKENEELQEKMEVQKNELESQKKSIENMKEKIKHPFKTATAKMLNRAK